MMPVSCNRRANDTTAPLAIDRDASSSESASRIAPACFWAGLSVEEVFVEMGSGSQGLDADEAARRIADFGPNILPRPEKPPWYCEFFAQFTHLIAVLLWIAAVFAWLAGMPELSWAVVAVIIINGAFSYWQQYRAERAIEALESLLPCQVSIRRGGNDVIIPASSVVPGDVLLLTEGEAIPADARIIQATRLRVDMSTLTGESRPAPRTERPTKASGRTTSALPNLVLAGTSIASGRAEAVVFATGGKTEFGRIASLTQRQPEHPSPLQVQIVQVTRVITLLALVIGLVFFAVGTSVGGLALVPSFIFALGMIVANVPEGLLPTITLALALGVQRMAARNALVKRLEKIETLGATTVILSDKTGTLTENRTTVRQAWIGGVICSLDNNRGVKGRNGIACNQVSKNLEETLRTAALCCDLRLLSATIENGNSSIVGDSMERAILVAAVDHGLAPADRQSPRLAELPFDSARKRMTTIHEIDHRPVACVKGAMNSVLPRCASLRQPSDDQPLDDGSRQQIVAAHDELARRGLRVLAVAMRSIESANRHGSHWHAEEVEQGLTFLGLLAMEDPPRAEVPAAISACKQAGIRTLMVTGDDGLTAAAIGKEIGLYDDNVRIITGTELDGLHNDQLREVIKQKEILFARVSPEHKLRLVEAFQANGEVVAVTGDGVNDAPALKRADIGVAMGRSGTEVARESADLVLVDDNFASIVAAVEEGRAIYENLRKFITYLFTSNVAEAVPFIAFVLFRIPLPLAVMQILAIDLGTNLLPALALGAEPPEPGIMQRNPRRPTEHLVNGAMLWRAYGWLGLIEGGLSLGGFFFAYWLFGWRSGEPMTESNPVYATATTMSLAAIVACQVGNVLACRSSRESALRMPITRNRLLWIGIAVELLLLGVLIYVPPLANAFGLAPLHSAHWALLATFPFVLLSLEEARKAIVRARAR